MAITFPAAPTNGQIYTDTTSGQSWTWDGVKWKGVSDANLWSKAGTTLSPATAGDVVDIAAVPTIPDAGAANARLTGTTCKAWVNFNGTGTVAIRASYNVSSIKDNGVGDYTVNFTTAMPDVNYSVCGSSADNNGGTTPTLVWLRSQAVAPTTSAVRIGTRTVINTDADTAYATVAIFR